MSSGEISDDKLSSQKYAEGPTKIDGGGGGTPPTPPIIARSHDLRNRNASRKRDALETNGEGEVDGVTEGKEKWEIESRVAG